MLIKFRCPNCFINIEADSTQEGDQDKCPSCGHPILIPHATIGPGTTIGGFRITGRLGVGGMGDVYLAEQRSMGRDVALKILPPALTRDKMLTYRFIKEIKLLGNLRHKNIVVAHDAGEDNNIHYLAMEYVDGKSLAEILEDGSPMPEEEVLVIASKVADALRYAWEEKKFIHRDIKPGNIMIDKSGEVKVMDLGLAKSMGEYEGDSMTGFIVGTPQYMSPEQIHGEHPVDFRSDIYGLGATMWHMITGKTPFAGNNVIGILQQQLTEPLAPPQTINKETSLPFVHLLEATMARNPAHRHASYTELIEDIERVAQGELPRIKKPEAGKSVVASTAKIKRPRKTPSLSDFKLKKRFPVINIIGFIAFFVLIIIAADQKKKLDLRNAEVIKQVNEANSNNRTVRPAEKGEDKKPGLTAAAMTRKNVEDSFDFALKKQAENPLEFNRNRTLFNQVRLDAEKILYSKFTVLAREELVKIDRLEKQAVNDILGELNREAEAFIKDGEFQKAIALFENYSGPYAIKTAAARINKAEALKGQLTQFNQLQERNKLFAHEKIKEIYEELAASLIQRKSVKSTTLLLEQKVVAEKNNEMKKLLKKELTIFKDAGTIAENIIQTYKTDVGKVIIIELRTGPAKFSVLRVLDDRIKALRNVRSGSAEQEIFAKDLSVKEILRRLSLNESAGASLLKATLSLSTRDSASAINYFEQSGSSICRQAVNHMQGITKKTKHKDAERKDYIKEQQAKKAVESVLSQLAFPKLLLNDDNMQLPELTRKYGSTRLKELRDALNPVINQYADTSYIQDGIPLWRRLAFLTNEAQTISKEQIITELEKLNSDYEGGGTFNLNGGHIESINLDHQNLRNLLPLKKLARLRSISLSGNPEIKSLAPLSDLPLRYLNISGLKKLPGLKSIREMPLQHLIIGGHDMNDLSVLQRLPLAQLEIKNMTIRNFPDLSRSPIEVLSLEECEIPTLNPLTEVPLKKLYLSLSKVNSIDALKNMTSLKYLSLIGNGISDLGPITNLNLEHLSILHNPVKNLDALLSMPLKSLVLGNTDIKDLSPIAEKPLEVLGVSPWRDFTRESILLLKQNTEIKHITNELDQLKNAPRAADFWEMYDAGTIE